MYVRKYKGIIRILNSRLIIIKGEIKMENEFQQTFCIPAEGTTITQGDIDKGYIRVTVDNKKYFPYNNGDLKIKINSIPFICKYSIRIDRSNLIWLGLEAMDMLNIKAGDKLTIQRLDYQSYIIERA